MKETGNTLVLKPLTELKAIVFVILNYRQISHGIVLQTKYDV